MYRIQSFSQLFDYFMYEGEKYSINKTKIRKMKYLPEYLQRLFLDCFKL